MNSKNKHNTVWTKQRIYVLFVVGILLAISIVLVVRNTPEKIGQVNNVPQVIPEVEEEPKKVEYVEIINSCGPYFDGEPCANLRAGPSTTTTSKMKLRNGIVLRTDGTVKDGERTWYKIVFNEWVRYPDRMKGKLYVAGDFVQPFTDQGLLTLGTSTPTATKKRIVVDISDQVLYAYEEEDLFMKESVSTGVELTDTPYGSFSVYRKTPSRYMQGPLPGTIDEYYDLPGVPWDLYFTQDGAVIHGAYWHNKFGQKQSHGCVNLPPVKAKELYYWAGLGTPVTVQK